MEKILLPTTIEFEDADKENVGKIVVTPCHQGYGTTLGNALRRVLLSSLPGSAVESIKIKGVQHEFSAINGVLEDVIQIILNIKQMAVKSHSAEPIVLNLVKKGIGEVTAADFEKNADVEIINKDLHIATLDGDRAELSMEIDIDKGRGYETVEKAKAEKSQLSTIDLDVMYSPVKKVRYDVEATRKGKVIDLDKLVLDVETDGEITPEDALKEASLILVDQFNLLAGKTEAPKEKKEVQSGDDKKKMDAAKIQIEELDLSARAMNAFLANEIKTVGEAMEIGGDKLSRMKGLGKKAIEELNEKIKEFDLEL